MENTLPNPQILLFDWSGTVSDDRAPVYEANQRLLETYGHSRLSLDEWRDGRDGWNAGIFLAENLSQGTEFFYGEFSTIFKNVKSELGEPSPYPGAVEAFKALAKGRRSAIISSHPQEHLEYEVQAYGLGGAVNIIRGSVADKVAVIGQVLEEVGLAPQEALYIGDTVQDTDAARKAEVGIAAVTGGYHSENLIRHKQPDIIVATLADLVSKIDPPQEG